MNTSVGFIGVGGIAKAIVTGLCSAPDFTGKIWLSNPSPEKTAVLKNLYPDKIIVAKDNQDVANNAEIIFPAVRPQIIEHVMREIEFRKENRIVHIAMGTKIEKAAPWFAPAVRIVRAVPLPFAAERMGPVVLYGDDAVSARLLSMVGEVVKVETERELEILAAVTGLMAPYYALLGEFIKWSREKGLAFDSALDYTCSMSEALSKYMRAECTQDVAAFLTENSTPGGTNEMAHRLLREQNAFDVWHRALDAIGKRYDL